MIDLHFNDTVLQVQEDDSSFCYNSLGLEQYMTLKFSVAEPVDIPVGAWCVFNGVEYTLLEPNNITRSGARNLTYTLTLNGPFAKSGRYKVRNTVDRRLKFSMCARPKEFLQLIVDNLNMRDGGWSVGECIDAAEKTIEFNHVFINDALQDIIEEFDTEGEVVGKVISLGKVEYFKDDPLPLSYGKGNGFEPGLGRMNTDDDKPVEVLFVQGSDRNIDASVYGSRDLLLPVGQTLEYEGRVYVVDEDGYSIRRKDKAIQFGFEDSLDCEDIYPSRVGTVSSVVEVDAEKNFYDIIDDSIPDNLNYRDCRIAGETMTIIFQSGMLAGREFDIQQTEDALTGYDPSQKRFEIVPQEIDGITMPGGVYVPRPGDTYAVFHCMLPEAYIRDDETQSGASWDMFREAARYMYEHEDFRFTFSGKLQALWSKRNWLRVGGRLRIGSYIWFTDEDIVPDGVAIRITGIKTFINAPYSPTIEISNSVSGSRVNSALKKAENAEVKIEDKYREAMQFTKRRFRDSKETISMLEDALLENFSSSINPLSVQTMAMLVGDESLQFQFVDNVENPTAIGHNIVYDAEKRVLTVPAGIIQHMTLGIKSISSSHQTSEYHFWSLGEYVSPVLDIAEKRYYLYAKVGSTSKSGEFLLSETAIGMTAVSGYYHLLVGVLNSEYDGERSFVTLYGFSEVLPGRITTDRIATPDGQSFFDMLNDAFQLHDKLQFNVNGDGKFRLKGTLVQNEGGYESALGVYRGVYDDKVTYYKDDRAQYDDGGLVSTYTYINDTPSAGHKPTDPLYWRVDAAGVKGKDGKDGRDGENGIPGEPGADGKTSYFHVKYSPVANPTAAQMTDTPSAYIGTYVDFTEASSTDPTKYKWMLWEGRQGVPGQNGEDGKTTYLHIKYSNDGGGTFTTGPGMRLGGGVSMRFMSWGGVKFLDSPDAVMGGYLGESPGAYIGMYHDDVEEDSTDPTRYTWTKIKGDDGQKGDAGEYTDVRWQKNGSTSVAPSIVKTDLIPAGWTVEMPSIGLGEYLWMTAARKSGDGKTLLTDWSTPVRFTPYDGKDGKDGESPALVYRGVYDPKEIYYGTNYRIDAVKYGDAYYVARIDAGIFSNVLPTSTTKWNPFGATFESVATLLLLAEYANIGNFVIKNNCLMSQKGTINGIESTDFMNPNFVPNILLDGLNGLSTICGSLRNPFVLWDSSKNVFDGDVKNGVGRYDNVVMPLTSSSSMVNTLTPEQFTWSADNSGRTIKVINYRWSTGTASGHVILTAPSGKYFYENGKYRSQIKMSRECLVLQGYGTPTTFYGWIVLARVDVGTEGDYGAPLKVLYQGIFNPSSSIMLEKLWSEQLNNAGIDENNWGYSVIGTGKYRIFLPKYIANSYWHVMLTGCLVGTSGSVTTNASQVYASLIAKSSSYDSTVGTRSYFDVYVADDSSVNAGGFLFQVISIRDWLSPTASASLANNGVQTPIAGVAGNSGIAVDEEMEVVAEYEFEGGKITEYRLKN